MAEEKGKAIVDKSLFFRRQAAVMPGPGPFKDRIALPATPCNFHLPWSLSRLFLSFTSQTTPHTSHLQLSILVPSSLSSPTLGPPVPTSAPNINTALDSQSNITSVQLLTTACAQGIDCTHLSLPRTVTNFQTLVSPQSRAINSRSCPLFSFSLHANPAI